MADSDDEGAEQVAAQANKERIFYGSIELQERQRRQEAAGGGGDGEGVSPPPAAFDQQMAAARAAGNINYAPAEAETMELDLKSQASIEKHKMLMDQLDQQKRARSLYVPTNDAEVRKRLRELEEPMTLFGEGPGERRDRLKAILVRMHPEAAAQITGAVGIAPPPPGKGRAQEIEPKEPTKVELFYTPGTEDLKRARVEIANWSLPRAQKRIVKRRKELETPGYYVEEKERYTQLHAQLKHMSNISSQIGDDRPLSCCALSPDDRLVLTGSWPRGGGARGDARRPPVSRGGVWDRDTVERKATFKGHKERVIDVAWHPSASSSSIEADPAAMMDTGEGAPSTVAFASSSADGTARLWSLGKTTDIGVLEGHADRLGSLGFHPSGRFLATASFDKTWRLWDVETRKELLLQEGHSRAVYGIAFHPDGSLAASSGLDSIVRCWDLRTGKSVLTLEGHVKQVISVDFNPMGWLLASASDDHTVRIWDLRKQKAKYTIAAHTALISKVKFQPEHGQYLASSSYDGTVKTWAPDHLYDNWTLLRTLAGHEGKVMSVDVARRTDHVVSCSWDRTWKIWAHEAEFLKA
eukprot:tig00000057_g67.t1